MGEVTAHADVAFGPRPVHHHVVTRTEATAIVQQLLRAHGHPTVPVDGAMGPATVEALKHFQAQHHLPPNGKLDRATVTALRRKPAAPAPPAHHAHRVPASPARAHGGTGSHALSAQQRIEARKIVVKGCAMLWEHRAQLGYSEGGDRWQGIDRGLRITRGQFPTESDCSSMATWILWNALTHVHPDMPDIVNGRDWKNGFTGTIAAHGTLVHDESQIMAGDLILYGSPPNYGHVTIALGGGVCFSHGTPGAYKWPIDYRSPRGPIRRFI